MFLEQFFKTQKYYHHDGSRHSHPHLHPDRRGSGITIKKSGTREIKVVRRVLDVNEKMADQNRTLFAAKGIFVLNVMSSPGSGKTTTLEKTLSQITSEIKSAVIVGDVCTTNDADRLAVTGVPVVQINTDEFGGDCHLAAHVIEKAARSIDLDDIDLLIVENVGNLVCPAETDPGAHVKVVILSVPEGDDKPAKYPVMFRAADLVMISKCDLLPILDDFDPERAKSYLRDIASTAPVIALSAKDQSGVHHWIEWITHQIEERVAYLEEHPVQQGHGHDHTHEHHHDHEHSHDDNLTV